MTDPFCLENVDDEDHCSLLNIETGVVMPDEKADRLINSAELGEKIEHQWGQVLGTIATSQGWDIWASFKKGRKSELSIRIEIWLPNCCKLTRCAVTRDPELGTSNSTLFSCSCGWLNEKSNKKGSTSRIREMCRGVTKTSRAREHRYSLHIRRNGHRTNHEKWWCTKIWKACWEILPVNHLPISTAKMWQGGCCTWPL